VSSQRVLDPDRLGDHLDRLYRAAWALAGTREEAEDLVQETYARVLARPRLLRNDDDLGYLLRALRNTFISQRRRPSAPSVPAGADELEQIPDAHIPGPQEVVEARLVYGLIATLPPEFRDALVAVDVVGLSYREAGRALRVRPGTLTSRLFRARQQVARALSSGGVGPP
jgi:RNA polymerase sigma-70 factor (ECF subfamily)